MALTFVGRLADRLPARDVVLSGVLVAVLGTLPFTLAEPDAVLLGVALFVRGIGFGAATVTLVTAAYRDLHPAQVPRATSALQIGQRVGAPLGAAVIAVVLQHQLAASPPAAAFGSTFWWSLALTAPALAPVVLLHRCAPTVR